ncbi:alpha/beta hydrolase [Blautia schinkii]|nr:alpha/beta hydrolase [Blautia schinkii]
MMISWETLKVRIFCAIGDRKRDKNLTAPKGVTAVKNIPYADGGKFNLLDIYYPQNTDGVLPAIVIVHGGGYVYGTKEAYFHYGMFLARQGFTVVNFNYHLAPEHKFPTQLKEINMVLEWMEKNFSRYHINPDQVFLAGDSAGAQIASHYCTIYSNPEFAKMYDFKAPKQIRIRGVALNCGMYDITDAEEENKKKKGTKTMGDLLDIYLGKNRDKLQNKLRVLDYISSEFPPVFVMTSQYDMLREKAEPMYDLLKKRGVTAEYRIYGEEGQTYMGHVFHLNMNLQEAEECNRDEAEFFRRQICSPAK